MCSNSNPVTQGPRQLYLMMFMGPSSKGLFILETTILTAINSKTPKHFIWAPWYLESPEIRLFVQQLV